MFLVYIGVLFYLLFFSADYNRDVVSEEYQYNLTPFKEILRFWYNREAVGTKWATINIVGNIVAFIPFGFFIPMISRRLKNGFVVVFFGFILSLSVELLQLVTRVGRFDVDDLILNTLGTLIGFIIFAILGATRRRIHGKKI